LGDEDSIFSRGGQKPRASSIGGDRMLGEIARRRNNCCDDDSGYKYQREDEDNSEDGLL
jgi:hypothetical protein